MAYFISTVRYDKTTENGQIKTVNEEYIVDALTVTEAEARTIQHVTPYISGEFSIPSVKRSRITEVFGNGGDYFWTCKVAFITIDERTATEKKTTSAILVRADDFDGAYRALLDGMKGTMADWELQSITLSKIMDYIPLNNE